MLLTTSYEACDERDRSLDKTLRAVQLFVRELENLTDRRWPCGSGGYGCIDFAGESF